MVGLAVGVGNDGRGSLEMLLEQEVSLEEPRGSDLGFVRYELGGRDVKDLCFDQRRCLSPYNRGF